MRFFTFTSILLLNLFGASVLADEDEAVTSVEPLARGNRSRRLAGSNSTLINLFPYHVSLEYNGKYMCGGAIVSPYVVLTAASCQVDDIKKLSVRAGANLRERGGSLHSVIRFIRHPSFISDPINGYNIAVIAVLRGFKIDDDRKAIQMFQHDEKMKPNSTLDITGFHKSSDQLQHIGLTTVPCKKNNDHSAHSPSTFCAGYTNKNICFEDKGSPVTTNSRLVGIVSHATNCKDSPGVITNVAFFRDWISSVTIL